MSFTIRYAEEKTFTEEFKSDIEKIGQEHDPDSFWIRSNGSYVLIRKMADAHIINALRLCKRTDDDPIFYVRSYQQLLLEALHRGLFEGINRDWDEEENK